MARENRVIRGWYHTRLSLAIGSFYLWDAYIDLKRVNYPLTYHETKVSEYTLLTEYNLKFINTKIKAITTQIEIMYHLNISHMTISDVHGVVSVSYPLGKLVINITDEKEKLRRFRAKSNRNM